jgi:hypothetical protein
MLETLPHIATVYVEETVIDSRGQAVKQPSSTSVEIRCMITPIGARPDGSIGQRHEQTYSLITRHDAPITIHSRVVHNGISMIAVSTESHVSSPTTAHMKCILRVEQ